MQKEINQLFSEKQTIVEEMNAIGEQAKATKQYTPEQSKRFEQLDTKLDSVRDQIKNLQRLADLGARLATKNLKPQRGNGEGFSSEVLTEEEDEDGNISFRNGERSATGITIYKKTKSRNTVSDFVKRNFDNGEADNINPGDFVRAWLSGPRNDFETRALSQGTDSAGGYTVPKIISAQWIDNVRAKSRVFQAGAVTMIMDNSNHSIAKVTGDATAAWLGENAAITPSDPTFGSVAFVSKSLKATVLCSLELLDDSLNIAQALNTSLTNAFAAEFDRAALQGAGTTTEPKGIFNYSSPSVFSMGTNGAAITSWDSFIDGINAMLNNNCPSPTAAIMAPRTWMALAKLKEATTNAPLKRPDQLNNLLFMETSKVSITQTQGSTNAASSIYMGGFENLYFGSRLETRLFRTTDKMASNGQFSFTAVCRGDWQPRREADFGLIKGII